MDVKKGTTTVGIACKDGVVLAADRRATAGNLIVDKKAQKVHLITDDIAVTLAGTVSDAQVLIKLLKAEIKLKAVRTDKAPNIKEVANLMGSLLYNLIRTPSMLPGIAHFLMAGRDREGVHLYDLFPDGSVTKIPNFVSSGSGSVMAYGLLEAQYRKDMSIEDGIALAVRCINVAVQRDNYSGDGVDVVKVTAKGAERAFEQTINYSVEYNK